MRNGRTAMPLKALVQKMGRKNRLVYHRHWHWAIVVATLVGAAASSGYPTLAISAEAGTTDKMSVQREIEDRVLHVLRGFDADALVFVSITEKSADGKKLPATPFVVDKLALSGASGGLDIESIDILIYGRKTKLPAKVETVIKEAVRQYSGTVVIKTKGLPTELLTEIKDPAAEAAKAEAAAAKAEAATEARRQRERDQERDEARKKATPTEKILGDMRDGVGRVGKSAEDMASVAKEVSQFFAKADPQRLASLLLGAMGALLLLGVLVSSGLASLRSRGSRKQLSVSLGAAADKIAAALQNSKDAAEVHVDGGGAGGVSGTLDAVIADDQSHGGVAAMGDESLVAMLCDCYWSEIDGYAALIWRKIPMGRRQALIASEPFLREYVAYLGSGGGFHYVDLKAEHNPYYLTPLPVNQLDNERLAAMVRTHPALYNQLSPERTRGLSLSAKERLAFSSAASAATATAASSGSLAGVSPELIANGTGADTGGLLALLASLPPSAHRRLKRVVLIPIGSIEEEEALLAMSSELSIDAKASLRSLAWLAELPHDFIEQALKPFNAKALATAWMGPVSTLEVLRNCLNEEKRQLLGSYLTKITPSRESPVLAALHEQTIKYLENQRHEAEKAETERKRQELELLEKAEQRADYSGLGEGEEAANGESNKADEEHEDA